MKAVSGSKNLDLTITVRNFIKKLPDTEIEAVKIDDYFYHEPKVFEGKTDSNGALLLESIPAGCYLLRILKRKMCLACDEQYVKWSKILAAKQMSLKTPQIEKIIFLEKNEELTVSLPVLFGWFYKKENLVSDIEKEKLYEKFRTDKDVCFECNKKYKDWTDRFNCNYCKKYHCAKHRLPENHNCWGNPKAPPAGLREIHTSDGGIIATGK